MMKGKLTACILIGLAAIACDRPGSGRGLGAGADTTGLRDTTQAAPTPRPAIPADTARDSARQHSSARDSVRNQTQSGMTNKTGKSTLGANVKKTRPDQSQPVTAKGDTLSRNADQQATDSLNRAVLDRLTGKNDTLPQPNPCGARPTNPTDTLHPLPADTTKCPADSVTPPMRDSAFPPVRDSIPIDTTRTPKDSTKQH